MSHARVSTLCCNAAFCQDPLVSSEAISCSTWQPCIMGTIVIHAHHKLELWIMCGHGLPVFITICVNSARWFLPAIEHFKWARFTCMFNRAYVLPRTKSAAHREALITLYKVMTNWDSKLLSATPLCCVLYNSVVYHGESPCRSHTLNMQHI